MPSEKSYYTHSGDEGSRPVSSTSFPDLRQINTEMRAQNFDVIRFATYRTACKLRFVQKRTSLHYVDIWNMIEAFRENGLNAVEPQSELNVSRLESLLTNIFEQLNKRLPTMDQITCDHCSHLLLNWLLASYDSHGKGRISVFNVKVALSHLCSGKLIDKLRYIFTQLSDSSGLLVYSKFDDYLHALLSLPSAVHEGPSFGYNSTAARSCFDGQQPVGITEFLSVLLSEPSPHCLMWLPILHRMAQVENVIHPIQCEGCHRESFSGFRYKCQRCYNYQLCQDCFWRGRTSGHHSHEHQMKEYTAFKSPAKQIGHSIKKSLQCIPNKGTAQKILYMPPEGEKTVDLSYIVPPTPTHNGLPPDRLLSQSLDVSSISSGSQMPSPMKLLTSTLNGPGSIESTRIDDEHRLIARYAARLAADSNDAARSQTELNYVVDANKAQRDLIAQLESKNRDIMREIQELRLEQDAQAHGGLSAEYGPPLLAELRLLRQRKDELEGRMHSLQESRHELMGQLEGLMKLLRAPGSPRSSPNSSPLFHGFMSPGMPLDVLAGVGGDVQDAFHQSPLAVNGITNSQNLRNDLLVAADSVTNAMSSLVRELHSEASGSDGEDDAGLLITGDDTSRWHEDVARQLGQERAFMAELRARRGASNGNSDNEADSISCDYESYLRRDEHNAYPTEDADSYVRTDDESCLRTDDEDMDNFDDRPRKTGGHNTDDDSYLHTDEESYIRTDDEDLGNADWEEAMKRWVNR